METRNERKAFYRLARDIARWIGSGPATADGVSLRVAENADVHVVEDGAFVEASMWVPRSVMDACGRLIAPPQTEIQARPSGPWDGNKENRP